MQRVDDLLVAPGTQRGDHQRLGFAAGEQRRAVGARQHAGADGDRAHGARVAAVDARLAVQNLAADDFGFEVAQFVLDGIDLIGRSIRRQQFSNHFRADFLDADGTCLLLLDLIGLTQLGFSDLRQDAQSVARLSAAPSSSIPARRFHRPFR